MSTLHDLLSVTPKEPIIIDHLRKEQNAHFTKHGYLILRQAFGPDELATLRHEAQWVKHTAQEQHMNGMRYWNLPKGSCKRHDLPQDEDHNGYSWGINEITRPELFRPALINALANHEVDSVLNALLDKPRVWGLKLLWASQK